MTTTFSWIIERLDVKPVEGELTNVVVTAYWRCNGSQGDYSGTIYNTCSFAMPESEEDFVAYDNLTLDVVLGWIWDNGVDKDATELAIQAQIDNQINPPIVHPPLPWN